MKRYRFPKARCYAQHLHPFSYELLSHSSAVGKCSERWWYMLNGTQLIHGRAGTQIWNKSESKVFNCLILGISCSMKIVLPSSRCLINQVSLPGRLINDWVVGFDFSPCYADPTWVSYFASLPTWPHSDQPNSLRCSPFFSSRAQMARFRGSCLRVSGVTALVKDPEAELIIVIKASYLHNTSQAEGTQCFSRAVYRKLSSSTLPCCCFPGDPDRGL